MIVAHTQDVSFADFTQYNWMSPKQRYQIPVAGVPRTFEQEEILRVSSYNVENFTSVARCLPITITYSSCSS